MARDPESTAAYGCIVDPGSRAGMTLVGIEKQAAYFYKLSFRARTRNPAINGTGSRIKSGMTLGDARKMKQHLSGFSIEIHCHAQDLWIGF